VSITTSGRSAASRSPKSCAVVSIAAASTCARGASKLAIRASARARSRPATITVRSASPASVREMRLPNRP
jgi:hypothetical protein